MQFSLLSSAALILLIGGWKVAPYIIQLTRRWLTKHWRILAVLSLLLVILRLAVPCPLRGNYIGSFTAHGCDDRAFLRFADGRVSFFHGELQPEANGKYQRTGWNTYVWSHGTNATSGTTVIAGWFFIQIYDGAYWLHRDLSFASNRMVERETTNASNRAVATAQAREFSSTVKTGDPTHIVTGRMHEMVSSEPER